MDSFRSDEDRAVDELAQKKRRDGTPVQPQYEDTHPPEEESNAYEDS